MRLINSIYYEDVSFSWGDNKIFECAHGINNFIGNPTQWVAIDTSHHIRYVLEEIGSFELAYQNRSNKNPAIHKWAGFLNYFQ